MSFRLVEESVVVAPRDLERGNYDRQDVYQAPDVGGNVAIAFRTWRCRHCGALAVGVGLCTEPQSCGKCHGR